MRKTLMAWAALLLAALPLAAQTNPTGTIAGRVTDDQGLAVPGVTVTATSPAQQGARTQVTSANGDYILPFLAPGEYSVTFELSGFASVKRNIRVTLNRTESLNVGMTVSTLTESITVVGETGDDFGKGATGSTSYTRELAETLPLNRGFQQLAQLTPGVQTSGPGGAMSISGAMSFENLFMVNGVVVQDNVRNTPFNLFIEDALQETTTTTNTVSAEFGRFSGGVVNTITKSGSNEFEGSFRTTFENNDWVALTPFPRDSRVDDIVPTYEATLGGPIVRNKLWFFGAGRLNDAITSRSTSITNLPYNFKDNERRYEGKLTFTPVTNHTFKGSYSKINREQINNRFGTILDLASLSDRQTPQQLISVNYTGIVSPQFFVEAQYSKRDFTFVGSGSKFTDLVRGTLLLDRSRTNARYNSPTFCGVCDDESRDNNNYVVKANYFLSTSSAGAHNLVAGFDVFDDKRFANNHQSGSDFRVFTTSSIARPDGTVVPVLNNDGSTFIRWTPIFQDTSGNRFRTVSGFLNDAWTVNKNLTLNLGVRYDKNDGQDSLGAVVVKDAAFSPRVSASFDPKDDGNTTFNASYGKYVAAIANGVGDNASAGGQAATIDFTYLGPRVNVGNPSNPTSTEEALNTLFGWFNANGGTKRTTRGAPSIPGVTSRISDRLKSPNVNEYKVGLSQALGQRGRVRVDAIYRNYRDFYSTRQDLTTGTNTDQFGQLFDFNVIENSNVPTRRYKALNFQLDYKPVQRLTVAGNYTLSRTYGTFDGETTNSGPGTAGVAFYPEYFDLAWGSGAANGGGGPEGDLLSDSRHKLRLWAAWDAPVPRAVGKLSLSWLQFYNSGTPYGAVGTIDTTPYVSNPGYVTPPESNQEYFFTARDAFRTASTHRSDIGVNYSIPLGVRKTELFFRFVMNNVFNRQEVTNFFDPFCGVTCINTTVRTNNNQSSLKPFNPFTEAPVEGVNWAKASGAVGNNFGDPLSRFAYQTPRTYNFSLGFRF